MMNGSSPAGVTPTSCPIFSGWRTTKPRARRSASGAARSTSSISQNPIRWSGASSRQPITLGLPRCADFNCGDPEGFGPRQAAIRDGRRESGVTAYLNPARHRPNLEIVTGALVTRVSFEGRRATGVEIERGGARSIVRARREVIVACGAYGSPQLLQLSGVGDAAALQSLGMAPLLDLPAVGRNLHDHPAASVAVRTANTESYGLSWRTVPRSVLIAAQYLLLRSGPLASNVFEGQWLHAFEAGSGSPRSADHLHAGPPQCQRSLAAARTWLRHHLREPAAGQPRQRHADRQ